MEALLSGAWLAPVDGGLTMRDDASLALLRENVREVAAGAGIDAELSARAALVATELGRNQLRHAERGRVGVRALSRSTPDGERRGLEIIAADRGRGIREIRAALSGTPRISGSLGVGLAMVRDHALEVDFDIRLDEGSCITARLFPSDVPRRREVGVLGRPIAGEPISGDHALFWRTDRDLNLAVIDGLGHGPLAREAADAAVAALRRHPNDGPVELLHACDRDLAGTRGAVVAILRLDEESDDAELASVGNVALQISDPRRKLARRFGASSAVLGGRRAGTLRVRPETTRLEPGEVVFLASDGLKTQTALEEDRDLLREHPIVIAESVLARFARENDDALVLIAR